MRFYALTVLVLATAFLAGCETGSQLAQEARPINLSYTQDKLGRSVADPIAEYVVNTPPGNTGNVTLANGRSAIVRVGQDYISAANKKCRNIIVQYPDGRTQANAVCYSGSAWKTVLGKL